MADPQAPLSVCDLRPDDDEPEEEDQSSVLVVKPPPVQLKETIMPHLTNSERVYPWTITHPDSKSNITGSSPTTRYNTAVRSDPGPRATTALLGGSSTTEKKDVNYGAESPLGYGTNVSMQRRQSILRMSASKTCVSHGMKKSASVEFVLDHANRQAAQSIHNSASSIGREPRRLTVEEKEELYRIRPDLEIGPTPFYIDKVEEVTRRNQRRIIFAMFGGMISIVLLLVFFSMWEQNK